MISREDAFDIALDCKLGRDNMDEFMYSFAKAVYARGLEDRTNADNLIQFCKDAYNKGLEDAAKVCEALGTIVHGEGRDDSEAFDCADEIRKMKGPE